MCHKLSQLVVHVATVKDFIDYYCDYLSVNMDAEVVMQLMISQQLLSEDVVVAAQSSYHKSCLILQQVRLMDSKGLVSFCELLKANTSLRNIGEMLHNGKHTSTKTIVITFL